MELTAIIAGLLLAVGGAVVLTGLAAQAWVTAHPGLPAAAARRAGRVAGRLGRLLGRRHRVRGLRPGGDILMLTLAAGLAAATLAALAVGKLVDDLTHGDGVAAVDHPAARFIAAHRAAELTAVMRAVSVAGGPAGMTVLALAAGLLLGVAWRWWAPPAILTITAAGVIGLTIVFKAALGRARPPLAQAVAAADGYGFPSGHAAAAAAVCGVAAWLCSMRVRSWRAKIAVWAAAAMLAALVGISRVYLGVHWVSDVIGGWIFGILWMAVVMTAWATFGHPPRRPQVAAGHPPRDPHVPDPAHPARPGHATGIPGPDGGLLVAALAGHPAHPRGRPARPRRPGVGGGHGRGDGAGDGWAWRRLGLAPAGQSLPLVVGGIAACRRSSASVSSRGTCSASRARSTTTWWAARFVHRLTELIDSGHGLEDALTGQCCLRRPP